MGTLPVISTQLSSLICLCQWCIFHITRLDSHWKEHLIFLLYKSIGYFYTQGDLE